MMVHSTKYLYIWYLIHIIKHPSVAQDFTASIWSWNNHLLKKNKKQKAAGTVKVVPCHYGMAPPPLGAVAISHQLLVAPPTCRMLVVLFPVEWKMWKLVKIWGKICRVHYNLARLQRNNIKLLIGRIWKVQFLSGWNSHQNGHSSYGFVQWGWSSVGAYRSLRPSKCSIVNWLPASASHKSVGDWNLTKKRAASQSPPTPA